MQNTTTPMLGAAGQRAGEHPSAASLLRQLWHRLVAAVAHEYRVRRSIAEVETFDDAMLRDIGLERSDIERACRYGEGSRR